MNQQQYSPCPHCGSNVWDTEAQCRNCHKFIERCSTCRAPVFPGKDTCFRCGAFVSKEPKVQAKATLSGDFIAGREMVLNIAMRNVGNTKTIAKYDLELPETLGGKEIKEEDIKLEAKSTVEREYYFVPKKTGNHSIPSFEVTYKKSDDDESSVKTSPVNFRIDGIPVLDLSIALDGSEIELTEAVHLYVTVSNEGTAVAKNIDFQIFTPPTVFADKKQLLLPSLQVDEQRTSAVKLEPVFDGSHNIKVRVRYQTPATQRRGPGTEEVSSEDLILKVKKVG